MFLWFMNLDIKVQAIYACLFTWIFTIIGVLIVLLFKRINNKYIKYIYGISAGIMLSSSVFSLLLPVIDCNKYYIFIFALIGALFIIIIEKCFINESNRSLKLLIAMMIHNIPEGFAVGVTYSSFVNMDISKTSVLFLVLSIAIQNIPDGLAVSLPVKMSGKSNKTVFYVGFITSILEPIAGIIGIYFSSKLICFLPFIYAFSFGAIFYIVIDELIPISHDDNSFVSLVIILSFLLILFTV